MDVGQAKTLWGLFCERVGRCPDAVAYSDADPAGTGWRDHSWRTMAARVDRFRSALAREALSPGDRIAILLPNGIDWVCLDLAAQAQGLVVVGLYPHETAASNAYILGHSGAGLVLLDTLTRWHSLVPFASEFPSLERVWIRDAEAGSGTVFDHSTARQLAYVLSGSGGVPPPHPALPGDCATLIYTSGTSGRPKGVMLSHFALLWNARATATVIPPLRSDVFLSVLPIAHAFERTVGYYLPMMEGCTVTYARSAQHVREDSLRSGPP